MSTVICITGMHRSGTSLFASWLERCGLTIHNGQTWGPGTGNPKGHFEDKEFVEIHSSAILKENPKSKGWQISSDHFLEFDEGDTIKSTRLIGNRNAKFDLWAWKDPRSLFYLEHWKKHIPSLKVILLWRPCIEVVRSLLKRSKASKQDVYKINLFQSIKLWIAYNTRLYDYKKQYPLDTLVFPLTDIISKEEYVFDTINRSFGIELYRRPINEVFDVNIINSSRDSLLDKFFGYLPVISRLEKKLMTL